MSDTAGPSDPRPSRLGDRLRAEAARRFVGREEELGILRELLDAPPGRWPVLFLHGAGGVGKTALLDRLLEIAADHGTPALRLDARDVDPAPDGFVRALGTSLGLAADESGVSAVTDAIAVHRRFLLVVDTFEQLQSLEPWLRETFLPACPEGLRTVLAGRAAPQREWSTDPLWHAHARVVALGNLSPEEGARYVQQRGLAPDTAATLVALSHGHPLALSLLADIAVANGAVPAALAADVIRDLASRFTAVAPSPLHRRALEACAMLRRTTEEALARVVDAGEASALFDWLDSLNFVERAADGLLPHDLVRDAVLDELHAREPERYRVLRRTLSRPLLARIIATPPASAWPLVCDYNFLFRHRNPIAQYSDYRTMGSAHFRPATSVDAPAIDALVTQEMTPAEVPLVRRWLAHPAAITWVAGRTPSRVDGLALTLDLALVDDEMRAADPVIAALHDALDRLAPPIPGRRRLLTRHHAKRGGMFDVSGGVANAIQMSEWFLWLTTPALHVCALCVPRPAHWEHMMAYYGFALLPGGSFEVEGEPYGTFWREWRESAPRDDALLRVARAHPDHAPAPTRAADAPSASLSPEQFATAVREALRDVTRDAALARSPLLGSRLVQRMRRSGERPASTLRRLLVEVAGEQRQSPRTEKGWRALDLTYFRPAGTQERAAERLGLPFNTYRYQLSGGLQRLIARLMELESGADA